MERDRSSPWIVRTASRSEARLRLFCLPYAGGAASAYRAWPRALPADVEVCAVQLPGDAASMFYGNTVVNNTDLTGGRQTCGIADFGGGADDPGTGGGH